MNGSSRPAEARDRVLAQLPETKQLEIIRHAEKQGPRPDDPDWLLVETMIACAARMEAAAPMTEKALADFAERLERVEQGVDNLQKQKPMAKVVPAIPVELTSQLERLETKIHGLRTIQETFAFLRYSVFLVAGVGLGLLFWHLRIGPVIPKEWLIYAGGVTGAAAVLIALGLTAAYVEWSEARRVR